MDSKTAETQAFKPQCNNNKREKWSVQSFLVKMISGLPFKPRAREEVLTSLIF